ncbi:hypothetical protein E2C01_086095 [Portunus trituberculatus]|uniref:Uncharacterized protein n=1 Tax=Portunus trituberculatus TaxID=210409 RepID=A0A5B7J2W1_PORTR|nr:hypothetical protein [Portunus trituberculatus]
MSMYAEEEEEEEEEKGKKEMEKEKKEEEEEEKGYGEVVPYDAMQLNEDQQPQVMSTSAWRSSHALLKTSDSISKVQQQCMGASWRNANH